MKFIQWILVGILLILPTTLAPNALAQQAGNVVLLPLVSNPTSPAGEVFDLMAADPDQQRPVLEWNATVAAVAQQIADSARDRGACNFEASPRTPNELLVAVGYRTTYGAGNFIASIGCGHSTATDAWEGNRNDHTLGMDFWKSQTQVGVAYTQGGQYGHIWVVVSAPSEEYKFFLPTMFN